MSVTPSTLKKLVAPREKPKPILTDYLDDDDYVPVGLSGVEQASARLLAINRGVETPDERDHIRYKRVMDIDRILGERIRLDAGKVRQKLQRSVFARKSLDGVAPFMFDGYSEGLLVGNSLAQPLEEINPLQMTTQARAMTQMGPGGLGSEDAITEDAQNVHPAQFGFVSPIDGPESSLAGIDVRLPHGAKLGSDGRIYQKFFDRRTKRFIWLNPQQADELVVGIPD